MKLTAGTYSVGVANSDGTVTPLPAPGKVTFKSRDETLTGIGIHSSAPQTFSMSFPLTPEGEAFFAATQPPPPTEQFKLAADGRVLVDGSTVSINGEYLSASWYFIDIIDRSVWQYALREGLQLEDAVFELNATARKYKEAS